MRRDRPERSTPIPHLPSDLPDLTGRRLVVTGGAGFIGSHLVDRLVARGAEVTVLDNLSIGRREFLAGALESGRVRLEVGDLRDLDWVERMMPGHEAVFHLSANPEARWGLENTRLDLEQETLVTYNCLEAMRRTGVAQIVFASSGTVYGETDEACGEDFGPILPISLYGAGKVASESLISAFAHTFDMRAWICRFANIVGPRGTHGVMVDFIKKLDRDPTRLEILGDGRQAKPYVHVADLVEAILFIWTHSADRVNYYNVAVEDQTTVREIAEIVVAALGLEQVKFEFTGGERGWPGDVPRSRMRTDKLAALGWRVSRTSRETVEEAAAQLVGEYRNSECRIQNSE